MNASGMSRLRDPLFHNHLEFLRTHLATVTSTRNGHLVNSKMAAFNLAVPAESASIQALVAQYGQFYLMPYAYGLERQLWEMGFESKHVLNYMTRPLFKEEMPVSARESVVRVRTAKGMEDFSTVQATGFAGSEAEVKSWYSFMLESNLENLQNPNQCFFVAYRNEVPAAITLAVFHEGVCGLYGTTTLPAFRKQGLATALIRCAGAEAAIRGAERIALQASHGSYDEFFYRRSGFVSSFLVKVLARPYVQN